MPSSLRDLALGAFAWTSALLVSCALLWLIVDVLSSGVSGLSWSFLVEMPLDAGRSGGVGPILVSTAWILGICLLVAIPLGLATALVLADQSSRLFPRLVRRSLDLLAGVPSIVFGLFGNAFFCLALGMGYSILSGGLTLACMVLPIFTRVAEQGLRQVPDEYVQGAAALGLSKATTWIRISLPVASPTLFSGLVLAVGRALAETAALIFTSGYVDRLPTSVLDSGRAMSVHIYDLAMNVPGGASSAYSSAVVLVALLWGIQAASRLALARFSPGERI